MFWRYVCCRHLCNMHIKRWSDCHLAIAILMPNCFCICKLCSIIVLIKNNTYHRSSHIKAIVKHLFKVYFRKVLQSTRTIKYRYKYCNSLMRSDTFRYRPRINCRSRALPVMSNSMWNNNTSAIHNTNDWHAWLSLHDALKSIIQTQSFVIGRTTSYLHHHTPYHSRPYLHMKPIITLHFSQQYNEWKHTYKSNY